jgi:enoyl-CoA hydratase
MTKTSTGESRGATLLQERDGQVLTLTINRPEATNAIDTTLREELAHAFDEAAVNKNLRAIILTSSGDDAFSVGMDIGELAGFAPAEVEQVALQARGVYDRISARGLSLRCMRTCESRARTRVSACRVSMSV